ncbi:MAG: alpha/beta hydrolase [Chitinophagales bacterium]
MNVYLIPGLGADKRMYINQLKLFPEAVVLEHLHVITDNNLADYAQRFLPLIDTSKPFVLIGTSLGGMIAQELSRSIKPEKLILISTIKGRHEMPFFIRSMKQLRLHRLLTGENFLRFNSVMAKRLDSRGDSPAAELIMQMSKDAHPRFVEWAINAVIHWQGPQQHYPQTIHIHGTNDKLFPHSKIKNAWLVQGGSHVMNMTMSEEVNRLILKAIRS